MLKPFARKMASVSLVNFSLPAIMVILILGTVAQKYIGLYEATHRYFFAPVIWIYGVPLPGMPVFIGFLVTNLLCYLILKNPWKSGRVGSLITHIGIVILLLGGLFSSFFTVESFLDLAEGETGQMVSSYHQRSLKVLDSEGQVITQVPFLRLTKGPLAIEGVPLDFDIRAFCRNCEILQRDAIDEDAVSMARQVYITDKPLEKNDEENFSGIMIHVSGSSEGDGTHLLMEDAGILPQFSADGGLYTLALGKQTTPLPFAIELESFEKELYPGTQKAKSYSSYIRILDEGKKWEGQISMNAPLRYKGYALFQSSFVDTPVGPRSVLNVVYNPVRSFPYVAGLIICVGIILQLVLNKLPKKAVKVVALFLLSGLSMPMAHAAAADAEISPELDVRAFASLPILDEGRIKPVQSFAASNLKFLSGQSFQPTEWLMTILFSPFEATQVPLIKVPRRETRMVLGLDEDTEGHLYTAAVVRVALSQNREMLESLLRATPSDLTAPQKDLLQVYEKMQVVRELSEALTLFMPIDPAFWGGIPKSLQEKIPQQAQLSFYTSRIYHGDIDQQLRSTVKDQGMDIGSYSQETQNLAQLSYAFAQARALGEGNHLFRVIPNPNDDNASTPLLSPWQSVLFAKAQNSSTEVLDLWQDMVSSFAARDAVAFNQALAKLAALSPIPNKTAFYAEQVYSALSPLHISVVLYTSAALMLLAGYVLNLNMGRWPLYSMLVGVSMHALAVTLRVVILSRPPVGTLYESVIFVGLVAAMYALWMYQREGRALWLAIGGVVGALLHLLAFANEGARDNMMTLTAVLNTHFWLTTHVLCISIGYGLCLITSALAHVALYTRRLLPSDRGRLNRAALLSLLFVAGGTILGGIWADQSWGRFWGWDPKENGALLITLWLIWCIHGRMTRSVPYYLVAGGLAYLSVIVGLSWFGVNLLSIGLHSYGFTDSMAWTLGGLVIFETFFVIFLCLRFQYGQVAEVST